MPARPLTVAEVAELLRLHSNTVLRMLARGELGGVRAGTHWRIPVAAVETYLEGWRSGVRSACEPDPGPPRGATRTSSRGSGRTRPSGWTR